MRGALCVDVKAIVVFADMPYTDQPYDVSTQTLPSDGAGHSITKSKKHQLCYVQDVESVTCSCICNPVSDGWVEKHVDRCDIWNKLKCITLKPKRQEASETDNSMAHIILKLFKPQVPPTKYDHGTVVW